MSINLENKEKRVLIETKSWMKEYVLLEIKKYSTCKIENIYEEFIEISFKNEEDFKKSFANLFYFSRTVINIFLKVGDFKNHNEIKIENLEVNFIEKSLSFEVDSKVSDKNIIEKVLGERIICENSSLFVDLDKPDCSFKVIEINKTQVIVLDLIGFSLNKREYKLNYNSNTINALVPNYLFYLMNIDREFVKPQTFIDPYANLGDFIIESSLFDSKCPLNVKKRSQITFTKIFGQVSLPKNQAINRNKYIAIVTNNKIFKQLKENLLFSGQKIKVSQYGFDFLDVKFKRNQNDFLISYIPKFKNKSEENEYLNEFFYQSEFIVKKRIGIVSKIKLNEKFANKYKLKIKIRKEIFIGEQKYFVYVIG